MKIFKIFWQAIILLFGCYLIVLGIFMVYLTVFEFHENDWLFITLCGLLFPYVGFLLIMRSYNRLRVLMGKAPYNTKDLEDFVDDNVRKSFEIGVRQANRQRKYRK